jgi:hypothetical protein
MATHKHWSSHDTATSAPAVEAAVVEQKPTVSAALDHAWVITYKDSSYDDPTVLLFPTERAAEEWKTAYAMENGDGPDEDDEDEDGEGESVEAYVDRFFEDFSLFTIERMEIKAHTA